MKRLIAITIPVLAVFGSILYWMLTREDRNEEGRYERGETELVIANLANTNLRLYKSGKHLADTSAVTEFNGTRIWLSAGNYFIRSDENSRVTYYPVSVTGYRCGPDQDGSLRVTIRPIPKNFPPRLLGKLPEFVYIPSGSFLMGDRQNPREQHFVWLTAFFISPYEVTNQEWRMFVSAADGYLNPENWSEQGNAWRGDNSSRATALLTPKDEDYTRFGQDDQPVVWITWYEANAFCKWLSRKYAAAKWHFSLPTDAEWEKAARGPDNFDFALSMTISDAEIKSYNWKKNSWEDTTVYGIAKTPDRFQPNRYGLYHMTGNVVEWSQSIVKPFNREHPFADDERNHDNAAGPRTARGGSWYSAAISYLYIPYRDSFQPEHSTQDIGLRIVAHALP